MIINLIVFGYILFLLFGIGFLAKVLINKLSFIENLSLEETSADLYVISGFVSLTALLAIVSIFYKIGLIVHLLVFFGTLSGLVYHREQFFQLISTYFRYLKHNSSVWIFFFAAWPFFFLVILYSACEVQSYDTGLYHAQFIQWIQNYRALPGLAWVHERFGFNPHFFLPCAFFNFSFLELKNVSGASIIFYPLNSFFLLLLLARCIFKVHAGFLKKDAFSLTFYGIIFVLAFCTFAPSDQSPMPDIITAVLIFYALFLFIEKIGTANLDKSWTFNHVLLITVVLVIVTFKLSAVLTVLLLPMMLFRGMLSIKKSIFILSIGVLIIVPYMVRNVIFTGWLIYPFPQLDFFDVDWKLPAENVAIMSNTVKAWAKIPAVPYEKVLAMPMREWVPLWWKDLSNALNGDLVRKYIHVFNLFAPLLFGVLWLVNKRKSEWTGYGIIFIVAIANMIFWFVSAPDPRFIYGYSFFLAAFMIGLIAKQFENRIPRSLILLIISGLLLWTFDVPKAHQAYLHGKFPISPRQQKVPVVEMVANLDGTIMIARPVVGDQCFNMTVPCAPYPNVNIKLRGKTLDDGFTYPK